MNRTELIQRLDTLEREMGWRKQHITDSILRINRYNAGEAMRDDVYFIPHEVQRSLNETREELNAMISEFNSILEYLKIDSLQATNQILNSQTMKTVLQEVIQWTIENAFNVESQDGTAYIVIDHEEMKIKFDEWLKKEREQIAYSVVCM